jgi:hypothetical protein
MQGKGYRDTKIIVLLTDFGLKDEYVGVMKGVIYSITDEAKIIDLCHEIPPQDIIWAGYLLYKSYKYFPKGSIFVAVIDPGVGTSRDIILMEAEGYFFLAPDNGLLSLIYERLNPKIILKVDKDKFSLKPVSHTFHGRDIFAPVAAHLSKGMDISEIGEPLKEIILEEFPKPKVKEDQIIASVIHVDRFGNLITNLEREEFENLGLKGPRIIIAGRQIQGISTFYEPDKDLIAIWESKNLLEIASPNASAAKLLGVGKGERVRIIGS